jgi:hypothetical protein
MSNQRISELTAKGAILESSDLIEISDLSGGSYSTKSVTGANIKEYVLKSAINTETTNYTLALREQSNWLEINSASNRDITVPNNSSVAFTVGTEINIFNLGTGLPSLLADTGVTILSAGNKLKLTSQYSVAKLYKKDTNTWILSGDLTV